MSLSTDQLTDRRAGLPASDFPAVLGLDPFRSPLDVWLDRVGKGEALVQDVAHVRNMRMAWGHKIEPLVCEDWEARIGEPAERTGTLIKTVHGTVLADMEAGRVLPGLRVLATPDRIAPTLQRGLEVKTHSIYAADYGPEGSDQVPLRVAIQCQIGMWVTGYRHWDVGAFYDGLPHWYSLQYDSATAENAVDFALGWWRDHVVAHKAPRPDGTKQTEATLRRMFPGKWCDIKAAQWIDIADVEEGLVTAYRHARRDARLAKRTALQARQLLEQVIGDKDGIAWKEGDKDVRLSWRRSRDGAVVDYQGALYDLLNRLQLAATSLNDEHALRDLRAEVTAGVDFARYTKVKPGSRRFLDPKAWKDDLPGADEADEDEE